MKIILILVSLLFVGCANIPLATMLEMRSFDEQQFVTIDAEQIQAKIQVDQPLQIDVTTVELSLAIGNVNGLRQFQFPLELVQHTKIAPEEGFFFSTPGQNEYRLKLSDEAVKNFKATQLIVANEPSGDYEISVRTGFADLPDDIEKIRLSIFLMLSEQRGFMTLFEDAELVIERSE